MYVARSPFVRLIFGWVITHRRVMPMFSFAFRVVACVPAFFIGGAPQLKSKNLLYATAKVRTRHWAHAVMQIELLLLGCE